MKRALAVGAAGAFVTFGAGSAIAQVSGHELAPLERSIDVAGNDSLTTLIGNPTNASSERVELNVVDMSLAQRLGTLPLRTTISNSINQAQKPEKVSSISHDIAPDLGVIAWTGTMSEQSQEQGRRSRFTKCARQSVRNVNRTRKSSGRTAVASTRRGVKLTTVLPRMPKKCIGVGRSVEVVTVCEKDSGDMPPKMLATWTVKNGRARPKIYRRGVGYSGRRVTVSTNSFYQDWRAVGEGGLTSVYVHFDRKLNKVQTRSPGFPADVCGA